MKLMEKLTCGQTFVAHKQFHKKNYFKKFIIWFTAKRCNISS